MRNLIAVALLALIAATPGHAGAGARQNLTHEAMWKLTRIATPALSPDGRQAVIVVTEPDYDPAAQIVDLWLVATDASAPPRRLTHSANAESQPTFSADGRLLAFVAMRDGDTAPQIYLLDLINGGEAMRLTTLSTGARGPRFSPDGAHLLFQSDVFPGTRNDQDNQREAEARKQQKHQVRSYDGFPVRNWDRWLDDRQTHIFIVDLATGRSRDLLAGTDLVRMPGFAGRNELNLPTLDPVWSNDGKTIVFVASSNSHSAAHALTNTDLFAINLAGGLRRLTGSAEALAGDSYARPQFSADGKQLHAQVTPHSELIYNATRIDSFAWPKLGKPQRHSVADTRAVDAFAVSPESGANLYILSEDAGLVQLERARRNGSSSERVSALQSGMYSDLQIAGSARDPVAIALYQSATLPAELVRVDLATGEHRALTDFNAKALATLDLAPVEHIWSDSPRGVRVHSLLLRPPGFDPTKKYPLLVLMHGGPHNMWRDTFFLRWNYHLLAAPGYVVLMTNYTGSTGFGERFAQAIQGDPFRTPADEINQAAEAAIRRFEFIDGDRQCAGGASYGGHLANWLQGTTRRYRCLISHAGLINLESQWGTSDLIYSRELSNGGPVWEQGTVWREQNPIRLAAHFATPTLVTVGELDFRVPMNNSLEYWSVLQRLQIPSRLLVYPNEDHWIADGYNSRHYYGEVASWLARWLKPEQAERSSAEDQPGTGVGQNVPAAAAQRN